MKILDDPFGAVLFESTGRELSLNSRIIGINLEDMSLHQGSNCRFPFLREDLSKEEMRELVDHMIWLLEQKK